MDQKDNHIHILELAVPSAVARKPANPANAMLQQWPHCTKSVHQMHQGCGKILGHRWLPTAKKNRGWMSPGQSDRDQPLISRCGKGSPRRRVKPIQETSGTTSISGSSNKVVGVVLIAQRAVRFATYDDCTVHHRSADHGAAPAVLSPVAPYNLEANSTKRFACAGVKP